jgi:protein disulfide-isomerase
MKKISTLLLGLLMAYAAFAQTSAAGDKAAAPQATSAPAAAPVVNLPYDEKADAKAQLTQALTTAQQSGKKVLVVFGANWCKDCRELDKALHGKSQSLIDSKFVVVKVNVGQFDTNLDLANTYGNPIKKGIPAAVLLGSDNKVLYSTKAGELADARSMGDNGIYDFFTGVVKNNNL